MLTQNNGRKMPIFVTPCILPSHTGFKNIFRFGTIIFEVLIGLSIAHSLHGGYLKLNEVHWGCFKAAINELFLNDWSWLKRIFNINIPLVLHGGCWRLQELNNGGNMISYIIASACICTQEKRWQINEFMNFFEPIVVLTSTMTSRQNIMLLEAANSCR